METSELPKDFEESFYAKVAEHRFCPKCGKERSFVITGKEANGFNTKTGKVMYSYIGMGHCNGHQCLPCKLELCRTNDGSYEWHNQYESQWYPPFKDKTAWY